MAHLIPCPDCNKHLQVPDDLLGKLVQCPECKQTFSARLPDEVAAPTSTTASPPAKSGPAPWQSDKPAWDDDAKTPPKKKRRRDDDDDDDEEDRDRDRDRERSRGPVKKSFSPHKGEMILIFGLLSLFLPAFSVIFGLIAWFMGSSDLREIREGRMDPSGEGLTQAGRIMGIVSVILHMLGILACCGFYGFIILMALVGAGAGAAQKNQQQRFR